MNLRWTAPRLARLRMACAIVTSCSLVYLSSSAHAQPVGGPPAEVAALFEAGAAHYARDEFGRAAEIWTQALERLAPTTFTTARQRLALDVALALEREFDRTGDMQALTRSKTLLADCAATADATPKDSESKREAQRAQGRLARVAAKLESQQYAASLGGARTVDADEPTRRQLQRTQRAKIAGGALLTLAGVGGLALLGWGVLEENSWIAGGGGAIALVAGVAGPVMIGFARRHQQAAFAGRRPGVGWSLFAQRSSMGLIAHGRF